MEKENPRDQRSEIQINQMITCTKSSEEYLERSNMTIRKAEFKDIPFCLEVEASQGDSTFSEYDFRNSIANPDAIFGS